MLNFVIQFLTRLLKCGFGLSIGFVRFDLQLLVGGYLDYGEPRSGDEE